MEYTGGAYDVAVIGAGHAGIEAALSSAHLGCRVIVFTMNIDAVGNMPCNPSIGGTGKGHLVREIDALGGYMGIAADKTSIQFRMLNRGKGPAVHSLRAQTDRHAYQQEMRHKLEISKNITLRQAEVIDITTESGAVSGVITRTGGLYRARAVIISTGTYLKGRVVIGQTIIDGGPDGMFGATALSERLQALGLNLKRFKTGTPPRINANTIDFTKLEIQYGDNPCVPFSFATTRKLKNRVPCYLTYSNSETHKVVRDNLDKSPLYSGIIEGVGPRYCPSFEDKVVRFSEKPRHQIFVEPMGIKSKEMYLAGFSSSMPEGVQLEMVRTLPGFEHAEISRSAYAIEYDCADPTQFRATLESKRVRNLYAAGQFCGTSGYEEAAALGLVAGINAARKLQGKDEFILTRADGYIGTLIDDIVTKGTNEPYRMMTSRTEYRLLNRQDNADLRLTPRGYEVGMVSRRNYIRTIKKQELIEAELVRCKKTHIAPSEPLRFFLNKYASAVPATGISLESLIKRPELHYSELEPLDKERPTLPKNVQEQVEISIKYEGYIRREAREIAEFKKSEQIKLPKHLDYMSLESLRLEARQKLTNVKPENIGAASRISGVSPSDIAALLMLLRQHTKPM